MYLFFSLFIFCQSPLEYKFHEVRNLCPILSMLYPEYLKQCLALKSDSINKIVHVQDSYKLNKAVKSMCISFSTLQYILT